MVSDSGAVDMTKVESFIFSRLWVGYYLFSTVLKISCYIMIWKSTSETSTATKRWFWNDWPGSCSSRASLALVTLSRSSLSLANLLSNCCSWPSASSGRILPSTGLLRSQSSIRSLVRISTALSSATIFCCRLSTYRHNPLLCSHPLTTRLSLVYTVSVCKSVSIMVASTKIWPIFYKTVELSETLSWHSLVKTKVTYEKLLSKLSHLTLIELWFPTI